MNGQIERSFSKPNISVILEGLRISYIKSWIMALLQTIIVSHGDLAFSSKIRNGINLYSEIVVTLI